MGLKIMFKNKCRYNRQIKWQIYYIHYITNFDKILKDIQKCIRFHMHQNFNYRKQHKKNQ